MIPNPPNYGAHFDINHSRALEGLLGFKQAEVLEGFILASCPVDLDTHVPAGVLVHACVLITKLCAQTWVQIPALAFPSSVSFDSLSGPCIPHLQNVDNNSTS